VNADWFYSAGDARQGPVTEDALRQLATSGQLRPTDLVWKDGMADWVEARTVAVLFPAKAEPARADEDRPSRRRFDEDDRPSRRDPDDDRPSRRGRRDDTDDPDDDRPRVRRHEDDIDDRYDDRPRRRRVAKPGQIQAVAIMMTVGGGLAILISLVWILLSGLVCCLWPGLYYDIVIGILLLIRGINMLNQDDQGPPRTLAILQIICIVNLDLANCVMGIVSLILLNDPKVQDDYARRGYA
jgi:hypothetical protein